LFGEGLPISIKTSPHQGLGVIKMKKMGSLKKKNNHEKWKNSFSFFSNLSENFTSQTDYVGMYSRSHEYKGF